MTYPANQMPERLRLDSVALSKNDRIIKKLDAFNDGPGTYIIAHVEMEDPVSSAHIKELVRLVKCGEPSDEELVDSYNAYCFAYIVSQHIYGLHFEVGDMSYLYAHDDGKLRESVLDDTEDFIDTRPYLRRLMQDELLCTSTLDAHKKLMEITAAFTFMHIENQFARNHLISEFQHSGLPITE